MAGGWEGHAQYGQVQGRMCNGKENLRALNNRAI